MKLGSLAFFETALGCVSVRVYARFRRLKSGVRPIPSHGREQSVCVKLPPLGAAFFAGEGEWQKEKKTVEPSEL